MVSRFTTISEDFVICCYEITKILHEVRLRHGVFCKRPCNFGRLTDLAISVFREVIWTQCLPKSTLLTGTKDGSWEELTYESLRSGTLSSTRFSPNSCSHYSASRRAARCTWRSTDPTGPRGVWAGKWHIGMAIPNFSQLKEEGYEMNKNEPCLFSKFAVREEPAVDGGSIAPGEFVGCCSRWTTTWWVALGWLIMKAWRDYGRGSNLVSGTSWYKMVRPFSEDATSHSYRIEVLKLTWRDFILERPRPISLPQDDVWTGVQKRPKVKWRHCEPWHFLYLGLPDNVDLTRHEPPPHCKVRYPEP